MLAFCGLLFYSLGLSGLTVLWNLGCLHFAKGQNFFIYQGFHTSLTGVRGFIGPLLGYFLIHQFGFQLNFIITAVLFLGAAIGSVMMDKKALPKSPESDAICA
jgi:MFS family permease